MELPLAAPATSWPVCDLQTFIQALTQEDVSTEFDTVALLERASKEFAQHAPTEDRPREDRSLPSQPRLLRDSSLYQPPNTRILSRAEQQAADVRYVVHDYWRELREPLPMRELQRRFNSVLGHQLVWKAASRPFETFSSFLNGIQGIVTEKLADKHKTVLCWHWEDAHSCPYGAGCMYAHGTKELRAPQYSFFLSMDYALVRQRVSDVVSTFVRRAEGKGMPLSMPVRLVSVWYKCEHGEELLWDGELVDLLRQSGLRTRQNRLGEWTTSTDRGIERLPDLHTLEQRCRDVDRAAHSRAQQHANEIISASQDSRDSNEDNHRSLADYVALANYRGLHPNLFVSDNAGACQLCVCVLACECECVCAAVRVSV
jgi:hypothetical protein